MAKEEKKVPEPQPKPIPLNADTIDQIIVAMEKEFENVKGRAAYLHGQIDALKGCRAAFVKPPEAPEGVDAGSGSQVS